MPGEVVRAADAPRRRSRPGARAARARGAGARGAEGHARGSARADRLGAAEPERDWSSRRSCCARRSARARQSSRCRRRRSAGRGCAAGWRPTWSAIWSMPPSRRARWSRRTWSWGSGSGEADRTLDPGLPALDLGEGLRLRGRIDRVDVAAGGGQAVVYDYKGRNAPPAAKWTEQGNVQVALYMRAVEELLGLEAVGGFYQPLSGGDLRARGVLDGESGVEIECVKGERREHAEVQGAAGARRSRRRARRRRRRAAASWSPGRGRAPTGAAACTRRSADVSNEPAELREAATTAAAEPRRDRRDPAEPRQRPTRARRPLTDEQEQAVGRRSEPLLLAAGAGSGKTSVLVERFVRAVREDGVAPGRILAITFTERAAGELRERVRARFVELGEREAARDTEAAFVSTFHGFCARLLRAHPLAAGLDPGVHDPRRRPRRAPARDRPGRARCGGFLEGERSEAVDLVAAWGADRVRAMVRGVYAELRSQGERLPRLPASVFQPTLPAPVFQSTAPGSASSEEALRRDLLRKRSAWRRHLCRRCTRRQSEVRSGEISPGADARGERCRRAGARRGRLRRARGPARCWASCWSASAARTGAEARARRGRLRRPGARRVRAAGRARDACASAGPSGSS